METLSPEVTNAGQALVTCIVVTYNSGGYIKKCLEALLGSSYPISQLIVVDNASADNSLRIVEANFPTVQVLRSERNLGFAGGVNLGLAKATGDFVAIVNPDVVVRRDWLAELIAASIDEPNVGIAGGKLYYPDGRTIQHAGGSLKYPLALADHYGYRELDTGRYDRVRDVDYVTGAAVVVKHQVLRSIGGLDEGFYPAYFEETDLCWRIREAGFRVIYIPTAVGIHHESTSAVRESYEYYFYYHRNRLRFVLKHFDAGQILQDFQPAEMQRLTAVRPKEEKAALVRVYRDALEKLSCRAPQEPAVDGSEVHQAIGLLWRRASELFGDFEQEGGAPSPLARLRKASQVSERPFASGAPVVGPAIARFREAWNWVSTKWYVRQLLQQQNRFNAELVDYVAEMEEKMVELRRNLGEVEQMVVEADRKGVELAHDLAALRCQVHNAGDPSGAEPAEQTRLPRWPGVRQGD